MENEITIREYKSLKDNPELKKQAMAMYMSDDFFPTEIAEYLGVDINELGEFVFGRDKSGTNPSCWKAKKDRGEVPRYIQVYERVKPLYLKKTEKKTLDITNKLLDKIANDPDLFEEMGTRDLKNLIDSMEKIDRISRLEEGKATSHVASERTTFTLRDILNKNSNNIEDADVIEIKNDK